MNDTRRRVPTSLGRDRLRKLYKLPEPSEPADPEVLARRKHHEAAAKWLAKWSSPLQATFALIGFVVVLLPTFSKSWRGIIENTPIAARVFHDFSTLSGWAMVLFLFLIMLFFVLNWRVKDYPGGWHPTKQWGFPSPKQTVEMELYPRVLREEFIYWVGFALATCGTTIWMISFGVIAFFIRIGV